MEFLTISGCESPTHSHEESGSFLIDTQSGEDEVELLLLSLLTGLLDQTGLSTDLSGDLSSVSIGGAAHFIMGQTGSTEDGDLLSSSDRVHDVDGGDTFG